MGCPVLEAFACVFVAAGQLRQLTYKRGHLKQPFPAEGVGLTRPNAGASGWALTDASISHAFFRCDGPIS